MKNRDIERVGSFRHRVDNGGRLTSNHAKTLLEIAEVAIYEANSFENRLVLATSAGNLANEECRKSKKACDALRSEHANVLDQAAKDAEKVQRERDADCGRHDNLLALATGKIETLERQLAEAVELNKSEPVPAESE